MISTPDVYASGTVSLRCDVRTLQSEYDQYRYPHLCDATYLPKTLIGLIQQYTPYQPVFIVGLVLPSIFELHNFCGFRYFSIWNRAFPPVQLDKDETCNEVTIWKSDVPQGCVLKQFECWSWGQNDLSDSLVSHVIILDVRIVRQ